MAFPLKSFKRLNRRIKNPWLTKEIMDDAYFLRELHICKSDNNVKQMYNDIEKRHQLNVITAKKRNHFNVISNADNKSKAVWNITKSNCGTGTRKKIPDALTDDDDNKFQNMFDKANAFNNYFIDSIKNLTEKCEKINPTISHVRDYHSMYLFEVDHEELSGMARRVFRILVFEPYPL
ncbi:hypothetical protein WA026_019548 [Henosepilachna vigintioctopunctata]|uniref:Uncharacterized protein n=1 Tax=Henosepilachna vigintioctopunctata TaxID=420089 RepID=A0AAW1TX88_9CUCU